MWPKFARQYNFKHVSLSPHYPQSNGLAEDALKIIKVSLKKLRDPYKAAHIQDEPPQERIHSFLAAHGEASFARRSQLLATTFVFALLTTNS